MKCIKCRVEIDEGAKFCGNCGEILTKEGVSMEESIEKIIEIIKEENTSYGIVNDRKGNVFMEEKTQDVKELKKEENTKAFVPLQETQVVFERIIDNDLESAKKLGYEEETIKEVIPLNETQVIFNKIIDNNVESTQKSYESQNVDETSEEKGNTIMEEPYREFDSVVNNQVVTPILEENIETIGKISKPVLDGDISEFKLEDEQTEIIANDLDNDIEKNVENLVDEELVQNMSTRRKNALRLEIVLGVVVAVLIVVLIFTVSLLINR